MFRFLLLLFLIFAIHICQAQIGGDFMIGGHADIIKTDNDGFMQKAQFGVEFNYFIDRKFTGTAGVDIWTDDKVSFMIGGRWYPIDVLFVRARGLIGENDLSIGTGWNKPFNQNWRFEAIADFYFKGEFAVRVGMAYTIRKK